MRRVWIATVMLVGCSFGGKQPDVNDGPSDDGAAGDDAPVADARPDGPPGSIDARIDATPGSPDANVDATPPPDATPGCPAGYTPVAGAPALYRGVSTTASWLTAEQDCENDGFGTHLVVPDSSAEKIAVDNAFSSDRWIGLTDRVTEGTWRAVTGQANPYIGGLGTINTATNCARIKNGNGNLEDRDCLATDPYVCECDGVPADPSQY